ncbi:MAG: alpha-amylase family glycosyl hydrolase [bacterium]
MRKRFSAVAVCLILAAASSAMVRQGSSRLPAAAPDTSWITHSAIYEVFVRDFSRTGDFKGVTQGLDRIQAVDDNVVWLMPIYPVGVANRKGSLGSPYAVRDYRAVNPEFGTMADFKALVDAVHARGLKLILDWVPNHTAWDNVWVKQHPTFHVRNAAGGLTVPRDDKGKLTDWTDVAQLDYSKPEMRRAMIDAMRYWLVDLGVDGFRMDAAGFVPDDFWKEALPQLRSSVKRPILLLAEWGDVKMHRFGFDLTYAWDSYAHLKAVWDSVPASRFVQQELADLKTVPSGGMRLRFTTNHDETAWDNPPVTRFASPAGARAAYVAMALLPGRPLIYDGQEVESPQKLPLFEREPVAWTQPGASNALAFYKKIMQLTREDPAFLTGDFQAVETSNPADVISYRRSGAVVLVNARPHPVTFTTTGGGVDGLTDRLSGRVQKGGTVTLPAFGAVVLERPR